MTVKTTGISPAIDDQELDLPDKWHDVDAWPPHVWQFFRAKSITDPQVHLAIFRATTNVTTAFCFGKHLCLFLLRLVILVALWKHRVQMHHPPAGFAGPTAVNMNLNQQNQLDTRHDSLPKWILFGLCPGIFQRTNGIGCPFNQTDIRPNGASANCHVPDLRSHRKEVGFSPKLARSGNHLRFLTVFCRGISAFSQAAFSCHWRQDCILINTSAMSGFRRKNVH